MAEADPDQPTDGGPTEPTTDPAPTPDAPQEPEVKGPADQIDWQAAARKHEREAKAAKAELDKVRKANLSESEKAIEDARDAGKAEARAEAAAMIAAAELKAAGVPAEDVADLNMANFIGDDGTIDAAKVKATGERFAARAKTGTGSADGGPMGDAPTPPSIADQIAAASTAGDHKRAVALKTQQLAALAAGS